MQPNWNIPEAKPVGLADVLELSMNSKEYMINSLILLSNTLKIANGKRIPSTCINYQQITEEEMNTHLPLFCRIILNVWQKAGAHEK